jgi:hypothetical protein
MPVYASERELSGSEIKALGIQFEITYDEKLSSPINSTRDISVGYTRSLHALPSGEIFCFSGYAPHQFKLYHPGLHKITESVIIQEAKKSNWMPTIVVMPNGKVYFDFYGTQETIVFDPTSFEITSLNKTISYLRSATMVNDHQFLAMYSKLDENHRLTDKLALCDLSNLDVTKKNYYLSLLFDSENPQDKQRSIRQLPSTCFDIVKIKTNKVALVFKEFVKYYDVEDNDLTLTYIHDTKEFSPHSLFSLPDGNQAFVSKNKIKIMDPLTHRYIAENEFPFDLPNMTLLPDGKTLVFTVDSEIKAIDLKSMQSYSICTGIKEFTVSPTGTLFCLYKDFNKSHFMKQITLKSMQKLIESIVASKVTSSTPIISDVSSIIASYSDGETVTKEDLDSVCKMSPSKITMKH